MYKNAIVGQSGGPTAAINATLAGVIAGCEALSIENKKIGKLYGMYNGIEGFLKDNICLLSDKIKNETDLGLLVTTPAAALGSCRKKLPDVDDCENSDIYRNIFEKLKKYEIGYFFYIGGNDSMDTVAKMSEYACLHNYEIKIIGVPKTIDNDLVETDHTPGFGSAAKFVAVSMQEIIRDCSVYDVNSVTIVEIMGRDAGWLTAASALPRLTSDAVRAVYDRPNEAAAPDLVYLPEYPFDTERFITDVKNIMTNKHNVIVAISEGIRDKDGIYLCQSEYKGVDIFGNVNLSGSGKILEMLVKNQLGCKVRSIELNILQRCASHILSAADINESIDIGKAAVSAVLNGETGCMMRYERVSDDPYTIKISGVDVKSVANIVKNVPLNYINAEGNNVTDSCLNYLKPLINGEVHVSYKEGLPVHISLK
jgi:6-phosphofructokinase 1